MTTIKDLIDRLFFLIFKRHFFKKSNNFDNYTEIVQNEYDENWGINPVGELMNHSGIITEINNVFYKSNEITTYLKNSTN